ncbi:MAG: AAA family ATPase [Sulfolobales archaeon]
MPIICFFGPDGSGKSTLAKILAKRLNNENFRVRVSWMRGTHTSASLLAKFLSRFSVFRGSDNPYYGIRIPRRLKKMWQFIEFVSMLPVLLAKFLVPSILGYTVIAERYIPDFIVWVALTTRDPRYVNSIAARFLLGLASRAEIMVYVAAEPEELLRRKNDVGRNKILRQLRLYDIMAKQLNAFKLDTTGRSVEESLAELWSYLQRRIRLRR